MASRPGRTLAEIADQVGGRVVGDGERVVRGVASLRAAGPESLGFLTNPRYTADASSSSAAGILVGEDAVESGQPIPALAGRNLIVVSQPYLALAQVLALFHPPFRPKPGIDRAARIAEDVCLGERVHVGPYTVVEAGSSLQDDVVLGAGCHVGRDCVVGARTVLYPRVVMYAATLVGADCILHSGAVLGADGFGFAQAEGKHHKIPQVGRVVIEDDVEIGANTTVDRGAIGETRIGAGSKLDNLVMVAHGVQTGRGVLLVGQSGIAGSTNVGDQVTLAGQAGVAGHLTIGDRVVVAAKSAVFADVEADRFVAGVPAIDHREWKRAQVASRKLGALRSEVRELRREVKRLQDATNSATHEEG